MATPQAPSDPQASGSPQLGVALAAVPALQGAFAQIPATGTWDKRAWSLAVAALIRRHAQAASALALRDYQRQRAAAGVTQPFRPRPYLPTMQQLGSTTDWTLGTLYGPGGNPQQAQENLVTGSERLILDAYRETVAKNAEQDRAARGWAREAEPGCCWFCAMLTTRGAIYLTEDSAGRQANERFKGDGLFKFHNNCRCTAVPVFNVYEPTARTREWQQLWRQTMRPAGGPRVTGMAHMQAAWQAAFNDWQARQ